MAVCPVCGCKTQDIDFVNRTLNSKEVKICSFCDKQLKKIEDGNAEIAEIRWLTAVVKKEVPERDGDLIKTLADMKASLPETAPAPVNRTSPAESGVFRTSPGESGNINTPQAPIAEKAGNPDVAAADREYIYSLETRIKKMEAYIARFKKIQRIKMILELVIPVILFLIILIVLFTSGIPDYFRQLSDLAEMTNCIKPFITPFYGGF